MDFPKASRFHIGDQVSFIEIHHRIGINTTLLFSLVQIGRISYPLMRDRSSGACAAETAWDLSGSLRRVFRSAGAPSVRQPLHPGTAERQRTEVDAAYARSAERH